MIKEVLKSKRGVSDVITTVLIVLLVLASTAIIGGIILKNLGDASEKIETGFNTVSLSISQQSVKVNPFLQSVNFNLVRNPGQGSVKAFNVVVEDSSGKKNVVRVDQSISELETKPISVSYAGSGLLDVKKVSVAPILSTSSGKEIPNEVSATYQTSSSDINRALNFDGLDDYVSITNNFPLTTVKPSFTIMAWAKTDSSSGRKAIVGGKSNYNRMDVYIDTNMPRCRAFTTADNFATGIAISDFNSWVHIACVYDFTTSTTSIYQNGTLIQRINYVPSIAANDGFYIGRTSSGSAIYFKGNIDEVRFYNKILSASEIQAIYNAGKGQYGNPEPNLVAGYHFDEGSGTLARDYSGNGNDGALIGAVSYV